MSNSAISRLVDDLRRARDVAEVVLTYAAQKHIIAEVTMDPDGQFQRFQEMSADHRAELLALQGQPTRKQIAAACELAGVSFEEAQRRRLNDTPEERAKARRLFGLSSI